MYIATTSISILANKTMT